MGLYNMVMGMHPQAPLVLMLLGLMPRDLGRFRDAWLEKTGDGPDDLRCVVYTRNGGGNRAHQAEAWERIRAHPAFKEDRDDNFDSTYAVAYFGLPAEVPEALTSGLPPELRDRAALVARLREIASAPVDVGARWIATLGALDTKMGG